MAPVRAISPNTNRWRVSQQSLLPGAAIALRNNTANDSTECCGAGWPGVKRERVNRPRWALTASTDAVVCLALGGCALGGAKFAR